MAGAGKGLENGIVEGVAKFAKNSAFLWTNRTSEPYKGFKRGRFWNMEAEDIPYLRSNIPEIEYITPKNFGQSNGKGPNVMRGLKSGSFNIKGDYPEYVNIDPCTILQGRWINDMDILEKRKVCVIGERVLESLFLPKENPIGQYIKISGVYYQVIGVMRPETRVNVNGRTEESVSMPFTTMLQTYNMGNQVHFLAITAKKGVPVSVVEDKVKELIKKKHSISPTDTQALFSINIEKQFQQMNGLFIGIQTLTWIVGLGTLLAGVIGVSNIMLVIIKERTKEIGIQRALGATPKVIISQIIQESVFLTTVAGYIGLSLGVGLLELVSRMMQNPNAKPDDRTFFSNPEISLTIALSALGVLIIAGLFAGLIPATRAIKIKPIEALREE
jgi:putative ABC transport system permease protein